jgi:transcription elongation factor/antiterminator RfaH
MTGWFVVNTKARREAFAQLQLAQRGVETFLPRILERGRYGAAPTVAPLFPGYLFACLDLARQHGAVIWTPGVRKLVGFGATPSPVDDDVVAFLQERVGHEGILRPTSSLKAGDLVRVTHGPFEGLVGIIDRPVGARGRVRVLMDLLRRQTQVEVPEQMLERISA